MPENFGYEVAEADALALVEHALRSPVRFIDTANGYSGGRSEQRIGAGIAAAGGLPPDVVVATKVDPSGGDYSGDRVRASVEESRARLGADHLPLVHLHDPEFHDFAAMTAPGGAVDALVTLKESGRVGSIGLAGGHAPTMQRYLALGVFDAVLVHNRWTLVDRSAAELIAQADEAGVAVVNAAVYGGGLLARPEATDPGAPAPMYGYRPASPAVLQAVRDLRALCARHGTDLPTAALQFSLREPRVASTVVGTSRPERLDQALAAAATPLPDDFWDEAAALVPPPHAWLDAA